LLDEYVVIDLEMTGLSPVKDKIIEVAAIKVSDGVVVNEYSTLVNPNIEITKKVTDITGITNEMTKSAKYIEEVMQDILQIIEGMTLIGHNIWFDFSFLMQAANDCGYANYVNNNWYAIDTLKISRKYLSKDISKTLENLCKIYGIEDNNHHRALNDAIITNKLYEKLCQNYEEKFGTIMPERLNYKPKKERKPSARQIEFVKKLMEYHNLQSEYNLDNMTQSELNRYADKIILRYGRMKVR
jgi:DNA polymerase-3 subunit alpha (Gram-positive type)